MEVVEDSHLELDLVEMIVINRWRLVHDFQILQVLHREALDRPAVILPVSYEAYFRLLNDSKI